MKLKNNLSIDAIMQSYIDTNFYSKHQLGVIKHGLKLGLDVTKYDDPTLPYIEMRKNVDDCMVKSADTILRIELNQIILI